MPLTTLPGGRPVSNQKALPARTHSSGAISTASSSVRMPSFLGKIKEDRTRFLNRLLLDELVRLVRLSFCSLAFEVPRNLLDEGQRAGLAQRVTEMLRGDSLVQVRGRIPEPCLSPTIGTGSHNPSTRFRPRLAVGRFAYALFASSQL